MLVLAALVLLTDPTFLLTVNGIDEMMRGAEYKLLRRVQSHCEGHECGPVQFNLTRVHNYTTQPDG